MLATYYAANEPENYTEYNGKYDEDKPDRAEENYFFYYWLLIKNLNRLFNLKDS